MIDDLTGVRAAAVKHIEDICALNINRFKSNRSRLINRSSLAELFISFLAKFAGICSRASWQGISPFTGQQRGIYSNMRWLPNTYELFVEDPFEQPSNTARTVSSDQMKMIVEAIQATRSVITSPSQKVHSSVVSVLVGSHISHLVARKLIANSSTMLSVARTPAIYHKRNGPGNHLEDERKRMVLQLGKQLQKLGTDEQQNGASNGQAQNQRLGSLEYHKRNGPGNHLEDLRKQMVFRLGKQLQKLGTDEQQNGASDGQASSSERQQNRRSGSLEYNWSTSF